MYFILKTKYTLSLTFLPAQVRGNNYWSQVRVKILSLTVTNAVYQANHMYAIVPIFRIYMYAIVPIFRIYSSSWIKTYSKPQKLNQKHQ